MENGLEIFSRLEERTLALGRSYRAVLEERNRLQLEVERQARVLAELEAKVRGQDDLFTAVDAKVVELLRQIDSCLSEEIVDSPSEQVLPGLHGN